MSIILIQVIMISYFNRIARLAQLVERHIDVVDVIGSNPVSRTMNNNSNYEFKNVLSKATHYVENYVIIPHTQIARGDHLKNNPALGERAWSIPKTTGEFLYNLDHQNLDQNWIRTRDIDWLFNIMDCCRHLMNNSKALLTHTRERIQKNLRLQKIHLVQLFLLSTIS
jgi:hypothetical protein